MQAETTISLELDSTELEDSTLELDSAELEDSSLELDSTELEDSSLELETTSLELETTVPPHGVSTHHQVWVAISLIQSGFSFLRSGFMV